MSAGASIVRLSTYKGGGQRGNKYSAKPQEIDGIRFASKAEAKRYCQLKILQRAGKIHELQVHPRYELKVNGAKVGHYTADFRYQDSTGRIRIEDVKSNPTHTTDSKLRIRLFEACYRGLKVEIVD